jgi:hypothetical protein
MSYGLTSKVGILWILEELEISHSYDKRFQQKWSSIALISETPRKWGLRLSQPKSQPILGLAIAYRV